MRESDDDSLEAGLKEVIRRSSHLHDFTKSSVAHVLQGQQRKSPFEQAVFATYLRMQMGLGDLVLAISPRHFQAACFVARCMFEHLLDLRYLVANPKSADAFLDFTLVKRLDIAEKIRDFLEERPEFPRSRFSAQLMLANDAEKMKERDRVCCEHQWVNSAGKPKKPKHWWDITIERRASHFGDECYADFLESYSLLSQYIHPGCAGIDRISPTGFSALLGTAHQSAQGWFTDGTDIVCRAWRIYEAQSETRRGLQRFRDALQE